MWAPGKLEGDADELRISSASKVSFGGFFEAVMISGHYRITRDGKLGDEFLKGSDAALRLVAAPS